MDSAAGILEVTLWLVMCLTRVRLKVLLWNTILGAKKGSGAWFFLEVLESENWVGYLVATWLSLGLHTIFKAWILQVGIPLV